MAQLAFSVVGRAVTGLATGLATNAVSSLFAADRLVGAELEQLHILQSTEGSAVPIVFGRVRTGGQVIWADKPVENRQKVQSGGKGGPSTTERRYSLSFAVGLCEGEIDGVGRIWADGKLLDATQTGFRIHRGEEDQLADSLIQAVAGVSNTPAFKGLAYVVFEDFPLTDFGNRIPQLSFEVFRSPRSEETATSLRKRLRGVTLIPGSGEFAYATTPVLADLGPGVSRAENVNNSFGSTDIVAALDDLQRTLPACDTISLVVSWFGDDLRCGQCELRPGVEADDKVTIGEPWSVNGIERNLAHLVTQSEGRPAFGGTPSDASILQAIAEIKARGFRVIFYPFILMDVPTGNGLPDPYGGTEQAAFPWRGRITSFPAPGQPNSPDKSAAVQSQIDGFFGTAASSDFDLSGGAVAFTGSAQWSFRRMVLHYAHLCALAGGVDGFLIGSELRGLSRLRSSGNAYPVVTALCDLAQDAASILPQAKISYAADWSEYFGHQPADGTGDVYFHLDAFWAHPSVDFIGIDWYTPLADWREGSAHLDADNFQKIHDLEYLLSNIAGGEGYDWFYASQADREAQIRTPIIDGAAGKDWVFRYKDLKNWWSEPHFDRPAGIEQATATAWVPASKPIWFTETGCPAVDKGANQPNVFFDPKSSESFVPYFSTGRRDDLIQRLYGEAILDYWQIGAPGNPVSSLYGGPMVDPANIQFWTWDARPFPDFPARSEVWSDGENWQLGHWLNGRIGFSSLGEVITDLCEQANISDFEAGSVTGVVTGYVVRGGGSLAQALSPLAEVFGVDLNDRFGSLVFSTSQNLAVVTGPGTQDIVLSNNQFGAERTLADQEQLATGVRIQFSDDSKDFQPAEVNIRMENFNPDRVIALSVPVVSDHLSMKKRAMDMLARSRQRAKGLRFGLPPSQIALEVGDLLNLTENSLAGQWQVARIEERGRRDVWLRSNEFLAPISVTGAEPGNVSGAGLPVPSRPALLVMDIPLLPGEAERLGPRVAAFAEPWGGDIEVKIGQDLRVRAQIDRPAQLGILQTAIPAGGVYGRFDAHLQLQVNFADAGLLSVETLEVLNGQNSLAIQHDDGAWEILQYQFAELQTDGTWLLSQLLRGQSGTEGTLDNPINAGAQVMLLDGSSVAASVNEYELGAQITWRANFANRIPSDVLEAVQVITYQDRSRLPRKPVHLQGRMDGSDIVISWIRRTRIGGDNWASPEVPLAESQEQYLFQLFVGGVAVISETLNQPTRRLSATELAQYYPAGTPTEISISVAQISPEAGVGETNSALVGI
ncbi:Gene Transfer Agent host specificity protein [hydrothermal vent metagenome]|uniref:Gene Transfer Agent host specificity protein n=1 Tax=hydrothermal vent metagenome TaxID=652676 RepID=A0A3B0STH5_9ZZZZ